ncbi:hypothetical protein PPL_08156 [Heterostelium album PN500]|uniref:START domain-containing protein n=1 Tax=Heterostelium pallidum (strain ATCC 26659 / Pp 5 / PN500) TaxID=670386 RepID=D3BIS1_HETP5|nr:hypothetical protein PPL_08156 [Heterostelium album PN500]EFA78695.1 hypothetical protein PPL_08156 [Heterostelium album PN500]|eukprot:XP_020430819.1 hypothetical protein PPL_08156 [Heterostelium album PN500]
MTNFKEDEVFKIPSHLSKEFIEKEKIRLWTVALQSRLELSAQITNTKWVFVGDQGGIKYWKRENPLSNTTHSSKSEIIVNKSTSTVMSFMSDIKRLHLWNKYFSSCTKITDLIDNKNVYQDCVLLHGSPHLWLPGRDSCLVKYSGPHPHLPKSYVRVIRSVETPLCPEIPEYMRTQLISGFTVEEINPNTSRITNVIVHDFKVCNPPSVWDSWLVPFIAKCDSWTINKMEKLKHFIELEPTFDGDLPQKRPTKKQQKQKQRKEKADQPFKNLVFINNFVDKDSSEIITTTSVMSNDIDNNNNNNNKRKMDDQQSIKAEPNFDQPSLFSLNPKKKSEDILDFLDEQQHHFNLIFQKNGVSLMGMVIPENRINFTNLPLEKSSLNNNNNNIINNNNNNNKIDNLNSVNNLLNNTSSNEVENELGVKYQDIQDYINSQSAHKMIYVYKAVFTTQSSPSSILFSLLDSDKRKNWGRPFVTNTNELWEKNNMAAMEIKSHFMNYFTNGKSTTIPLDYYIRVSQHILEIKENTFSNLPDRSSTNHYNNNNNNSGYSSLLVTLEERSNGDTLLVRQENLVDERHTERHIELIFFLNNKNWAWSNVIVDNQPLATAATATPFGGPPLLNTPNNNNNNNNFNNNHHHHNQNQHHQNTYQKSPIVNYNFLDRVAMNASLFFKESIDEEQWRVQQPTTTTSYQDHHH